MIRTQELARGNSFVSADKDPEAEFTDYKQTLAHVRRIEPYLTLMEADRIARTLLCEEEQRLAKLRKREADNGS